jgi:hypothetical protein
MLVPSTTSPRSISAILVGPFALLVAPVAIRRIIVAARGFVVRHGRGRRVSSFLPYMKLPVMRWSGYRG